MEVMNKKYKYTIKKEGIIFRQVEIGHMEIRIIKGASQEYLGKAYSLGYTDYIDRKEVKVVDYKFKK